MKKGLIIERFKTTKKTPKSGGRGIVCMRCKYVDSCKWSTCAFNPHSLRELELAEYRLYIYRKRNTGVGLSLSEHMLRKYEEYIAICRKAYRKDWVRFRRKCTLGGGLR